MKKLLYISHAYTTHDYRFLVALAAAGYQVGHLRLSADALDSRRAPDYVRTFFLPEECSLQVALAATSPARAAEIEQRQTIALGEIAASFQPQVTIAGEIPTGAYLAAKANLHPLVAMSWGSDLLVQSVCDENSCKRSQYALRQADGLLGDCRAVLERAQQLSSRAESEAAIFPWGVDSELFSPGVSRLAVAREENWQQGPVFLSLRSWEPIYRVDLVVGAFARVYRRFPAARLMLLGDGSQDAKIRKLVQSLGLDEAVRMPGRIPYEQLPDYYRLADYYLSAARSDGSSVSLLEALACGVPAIVTGAHGNLEWVQPGRNGWLFAAEDQDALVCAMTEAVQLPPARYASMHQAAVATVKNRADWNANFPALLDLLTRICAQKTAAA